MSVVYLTKACTLKCDYCFDKVQQEEAKENKKVFLSDDIFKQALKRTIETYKDKDISERSVCLSGGEPTLHPKFKEYCNEIIRSGCKIHLLSNFTFNEEILDYIKKKKKWFSYMVNVNDPNQTEFNGMNPLLWERTLKNLKELQGPELQISLNVWNPTLSYDYIYDVLKEAPGVAKRVRVGIINPIIKEIKETNFEGLTWIKYKMLGKRIDKIVEDLYDKGWEVFMDCGAGLCIFSQKTKDLILTKDKGEWNGCTVPIPGITLIGTYETCYVMVDAFNEDGALNITNNSIAKYINIASIKSEFYKNFYLTQPTCQDCSQFNNCPKFCTSNAVFYWKRKFGDKEVIKNIPMDKYEFYSFVEYSISNKFKEVSFMEKLLELIELKLKDFEKDGRLKLYKEFITFLAKGKDVKGKAISTIELLKLEEQNRTNTGKDELVRINNIELADFFLITIKKN